MTKEFKLGPNQEKWLQALESGEYKQGRALLYKVDQDDDKYFCCLGVACEIFKNDVGLEINKQVFDNKIYHGYSYKSNLDSMFTIIPPTKVTDVLGLRGIQGECFNEDGSENILKTLTVLNDGFPARGTKQYSFKEIAEIIRKNPSAYFYESK